MLASSKFYATTVMFSSDSYTVTLCILSLKILIVIKPLAFSLFIYLKRLLGKITLSR
jgi:hypothetical protein